MDMFKDMSILEFTDKFKDEESCRSYLAHYKWSKGFSCPNCACIEIHRSISPYLRRFKICYHSESVTAGTLFRKIKFSLRNAFTMAFMMSTTSKGMSAHQFSKTLQINKDTAWLFAEKIRYAIDLSLQHPISGIVEVDEAFVGGKEEGHQGRGCNSKSTIVVANEKNKDEHGIKRTYAREIESTSSKELEKIFDDHVNIEANVLTDKWTGYRPLAEKWNITQEKSVAGENFELMHRFIQGLKSWIRGIYHHVSDTHLQNYLDEYRYRFNRHIWKDSIFDNLVQRMMKAKPLKINTI